MTAPAVVGYAFVRPTSNATGTITVTGLNQNSTPAIGDVLVITQCSDAAIDNPTFTTVNGDTIETTSGLHGRSWMLTLISTAAITVTGNDPTFNGVDYAVVCVHHASGPPILNAHSVDKKFTGAGLPGSDSFAQLAVTTTVADCLGLDFWMEFGAISAFSAPGADTLLESTMTLSTIHAMWVGSFVQASPGTIAAHTLGITSTDTFAAWFSFQITLSPPQAPSAPGAPVAAKTNLGVHAQILNPQKPYDGGMSISSWSWRYSVNAGGAWTAWGPTTSIPEVVITGLTAGDSVIVQGAGTNSVGTGAWSSSSNSITVAAVIGSLQLETAFPLLLETGFPLRLDA